MLQFPIPIIDQKWVPIDILPLVHLNIKTRLFLKYCTAYYKAIVVDVRNEIVPASIKYPFGIDGNVIGEPIDKVNLNNSSSPSFPEIWDITEKLGFRCGAGNHHQIQIIENILTAGSYYQLNTVWFKLIQ